MVTHSAQFSIDLFEYIIYCFGTLPNHSHQTIIIKWIIQESSQLAWGNIMGGESACVWEHRHGWLGRSGDDDKIHIRHIIHVRRRPTSTHHDHMNTWTHEHTVVNKLIIISISVNVSITVFFIENFTFQFQFLFQ